uniref:Uncharacterized protein n=1 Tax=Panagrolaimus sp. JU765 TaxID=591449 RepID=A0AC34Q7C4_9BILA
MSYITENADFRYIMSGSSETNKEIPTTVAIQIIGSSDKGNYGIVYDLKDGKVWKRLKLDADIKIKENWTNIFKFLVKECPPEVVKSIFLNVYDLVGAEIFFDWLHFVEVVGFQLGYKNFNYSVNFTRIFTTELLRAKQLKKEYKVGDYVIVGDYIAGYAQIHLLRKQKIGWDVVDGKALLISDLFKQNMDIFFSKSGIKMNQVKDVFSIINCDCCAQILAQRLQNVFSSNKFYCKIVDGSSADYLEIAGEYLAKVYAGEEYFNDYDCFVGNVCEEKTELEFGNKTIVLPLQFKRLPCTIKQKFNVKSCSKINVVATCDHLWQCVDLPWKVILHRLNAKIDSENVIITLHINQHKNYYLKIEKDDNERTLIVSTVPMNDWIANGPTFAFVDDYCFDKEIYIGEAAEEYGKDYLFTMDILSLFDESRLKEFAKTTPNFIVDKNGQVNILVKTVDGIRKTTTRQIYAIFYQSLFKFAAEKMDKPMEYVYVETLDKIAIYFLKKNE